MRRHASRRRTLRRPGPPAVGALAVALAAGALYAQPGGGSAAAADFATVAGAVQSEMAAGAASSSADYFLSLDGIPGESVDRHHKETIELASWSLGANNPGSAGVGGGAGAGKVAFQDLHVTALTSKASPLLLLAVANGRHLKSAVLYGRKAGGSTDYLTVTLSDVLVSSFQTGAAGEVPTDQISLNFGKIEYLYRPQSPDGRPGTAVKAGWDTRTNRPA